MLTPRPATNAGNRQRGQALTEFALVLPLFLMTFMGVIILGYGVFLHQQVSNASREAARFAAVHSATAQCPVVSNHDPDPLLLTVPNSYFRCDAPEDGWPRMTEHMRRLLFGMSASKVQLTACWSGYWTRDTTGAWAAYDQVAVDPSTGAGNEFRECTVRVYGWRPGEDRTADPSAVHVINPRTGRDSTSGEDITIDCSRQFPMTTPADDMASNYASSTGTNANQVTVLSCFNWEPPMAGFLLVPRAVTIHAATIEALEYQQ